MGASLFRALRCDSLDPVAEPQFDIGRRWKPISNINLERV
jgi:hypothetical protein